MPLLIFGNSIVINTDDLSVSLREDGWHIRFISGRGLADGRLLVSKSSMAGKDIARWIEEAWMPKQAQSEIH